LMATKKVRQLFFPPYVVGSGMEIYMYISG